MTIYLSPPAESGPTPVVTITGTARACAGGVDNAAHTFDLQISATKGGAAAANSTLTFGFENNASHDPTRKAKVRSGSGAWQETMTIALDGNGQATIRVLSSDIVSMKDLVVKWNDVEVTRKTCNFVAMTSKRGFADPEDPNDPNWQANDTGLVCNVNSLEKTGDTTAFKMYLKYLDSSGILQPVPGHQLRFKIAKVVLFTGSVITDPSVIAHYLFLAATPGEISSATAVTGADGMAQVTIGAGESFADVENIQLGADNTTQWSQ